MNNFDIKKYLHENRITVNNDFDIHTYVKDTVMEDVVNDVINGVHGPKMKTELRRISSAEQIHEWANINFPDVVNPIVSDDINLVFEQELNEVSEPDIIKQLRDIVDKGQHKKIKDPVSGKTMTVDLFSASGIVQVYDKLSDKNKEGYAKMGLPKMQQFAMKMVGGK